MDCDGVEYNGAAFLINICNSDQYGYNVRIAPFAEPDDGLLDVVLLRSSQMEGSLAGISGAHEQTP